MAAFCAWILQFWNSSEPPLLKKFLLSPVPFLLLFITIIIIMIIVIKYYHYYFFHYYHVYLCWYIVVISMRDLRSSVMIQRWGCPVRVHDACATALAATSAAKSVAAAVAEKRSKEEPCRANQWLQDSCWLPLRSTYDKRLLSTIQLNDVRVMQV